MEIKTKRLVLRPLGTKYLQSTHQYASDIENTRYMVHLPNETLEETNDFLTHVEAEWKKDEPSFYEFAIVLDEVHIGAISLYFDEEKHSAELGWILDKHYWGKGYVSEAAQGLVNYGRESLGIDHFIAHCDSENIASFKAMEKLGMNLTDICIGRKNRASDEIRKEFQYEVLY